MMVDQLVAIQVYSVQLLLVVVVGHKEMHQVVKMLQIPWVVVQVVVVDMLDLLLEQEHLVKDTLEEILVEILVLVEEVVQELRVLVDQVVLPVQVELELLG